MLVTRTYHLAGVRHTREIDCTHEQLDEWQLGGLIQNVMPHLSAEDREFLMTGITPEEWDEMFGSDD